MDVLENLKVSFNCKPLKDAHKMHDSTTALTIYMLFCLYQQQNKELNAGMIAELTNSTRSRISKAIKELITFGYLTRTIINVGGKISYIYEVK